MENVKKINLFAHLLQKSEIPWFYSIVGYFGQTISNINSLEVWSLDSIYSIRLVPDYFKLQYKKDVGLKVKTIPQYNWGYSIFLNSLTSVDQYMENQFKSKYRSIIRRYVTRLENCFNIKYKLFYGDISEEQYLSIMDSLKSMIVSRFQQRKETHKELRTWKKTVVDNYHLIKEKKASLFVIYNGKEPIEISLNHHFDKILFSSVSSYDIRYSKFGLGHVEIYKQLEWCLKNEYIVFEMGVGGMDYKRRWSNNIYNFEHHIVYPNKGLLKKVKAKIEILKILIKEYLKSKKVNEVYPRVKRFIKTKPDHRNNYTLSELKPIANNIDEEEMHAVAIDYNLKEHCYIKKNIYDFLYSTTDHISEITVYKMDHKKSYIIKGKKKMQKVSFS